MKNNKKPSGVSNPELQEILKSLNKLSKKDRKVLSDLLNPKGSFGKPFKNKTKSVFKDRKKPGYRKGKQSQPAGQITPRSKDDERMAKLINVFYKDVPIPIIVSHIDKVINYFNILVIERGIAEGTKYFRSVRIFTIKHLLGLPCPNVQNLSLGKDRWPSKLGFFKEIMSIESMEMSEKVSYINTLLSLSRLTQYTMKVVNTFPSISRGMPETDEFKFEISEFKKDLPSLFKQLGIEIGRNPEEDLGKHLECVLMKTSGPNSNLLKGANSTVTAAYDANAVINDVEVKRWIHHYSSLLGKEDFIEWIDRLSNQADLSKVEQGEELCCSRIAVLPQPENKSRVVAIFDYFSQMLLKPLGQRLKEIGDQVPGHFVTNQDQGRELCKQFTLDPEASPVSADATDFTDRFHRKVQQAVLSVIYNDEFAKASIHLMCSRRFKTPGNKYIRYGSGQPMGAFASFPLASLTHLLYARWKILCFDKISPDDNLAVVGDDIAFRFKSEGYDQYVLGMQLLGVEFNDFKGFTSTKDVKVVEFCKHLYVNGINYSPISPKALKTSLKDFKAGCLLDQYLNTESLDRLSKSTAFGKYAENLNFLYTLPKWLTGLKNQLPIDNRLRTSDPFFKKLEEVSNVGINAQSVLKHIYASILNEIIKVDIDEAFETTTGVELGDWLDVFVFKGTETSKDQSFENKVIDTPESSPAFYGMSKDLLLDQYVPLMSGVHAQLNKTKGFTKLVNKSLTAEHPLWVVTLKVASLRRESILNEITFQEGEFLPTALDISRMNLYEVDLREIYKKRYDSINSKDSSILLSTREDDFKERWINSLFLVTRLVSDAFSNCRIGKTDILITLFRGRSFGSNKAFKCKERSYKLEINRIPIEGLKPKPGSLGV